MKYSFHVVYFADGSMRFFRKEPKKFKEPNITQKLELCFPDGLFTGQLVLSEASKRPFTVYRDLEMAKAKK